jgi:O-antigen chain-terminating methyltransferase
MKKDFYRAFEERYRGSRDLITGRLKVYLPFVLPLLRTYRNAPAIDLGCGRGEWLELLLANGFRPRGVDLDAGMLRACKKAGFDVIQDDALAVLVALPDKSQAIVSAFHLVEHIGFDQLHLLVSHAHRVLKPGGLLIMETPNPDNIIVATRDFYLDPTHIRPIPSSLLSFIAEFHDFQRVKTLLLQESESFKGGSDISLLDTLEGVSPDYSVVAQKRGGTALMATFDEAFGKDYGLTLESLASRYQQRIESRMARAESRADEAESRLQQMENLEQQAKQQAELRVQQAENWAHKLVQQNELRVQQSERWAQDSVQKAENRAKETEDRAQQAVQEAESRVLEAEGRAQLAEARIQDAEKRVLEAETWAQQAATWGQQAAQEAESSRQRAEERIREAEGRIRETENIAQQTVREAEERIRNTEERAQQTALEADSFRRRLEAAYTQIEALYTSTSWRITRPMRGAKRVLSGDFQPMSQLAGEGVLKTKQTARPLVAGGIRFVFDHPVLLRAPLSRFLKLWPWLHRRLMRVAANTGVVPELSEDPPIGTGGGGSTPSFDVSAAEGNDANLSPHARHILADLNKATARAQRTPN